MAAPLDRPGDSSSERPSPETSTRRLREQSQIDFELEFLGRILERDPFSSMPCGCMRTTWRPRVSMAVPSRSIAGWSGWSLKTRSPGTIWLAAYAVLGMIEPAFSRASKVARAGLSRRQRGCGAIPT